MSTESTTELLTLHAVRLAGFADTVALARRFTLDVAQADELLRDAETRGWVRHTAFAGTSGWSLTESGRTRNEQLLATELAGTGGEAEVRDVYRVFLPLNGTLRQACTDWQLKPTGGDRLAPNDHSGSTWDDAVLHELAGIERVLPALVTRLTRLLNRFHGYDARFSGALARARAGEYTAVDSSDTDSCHRVWFELHEDLVATLGIDRRAPTG